MNIRIIAITLLLIALPVSAQKKKTVVNDSNTPLHLLQPAYQGTYGDLTPEQVKKEVDRVFACYGRHQGTGCFTVRYRDSVGMCHAAFDGTACGC